MQIAADTVVSFDYTLTDDAGQTLDTSRGRSPLVYLHGRGQIVPGLEGALQGRAAGDAFDVVVPPEEGYGVHDPTLVQSATRTQFPAGVALAPGMQFEAQGPQGSIVMTVVRLDGDDVMLDGNHPLAGQTLHFAIAVVDVRAATAEELRHGHVHGAGGAHE
jgi:FKBP-type peptidyl-prolyl cis-trans isomerase SlyD